MSSEVIKLSLFDDDDDDEFFAVWLTAERRLALFPDGTIVRDPTLANLQHAASRV